MAAAIATVALAAAPALAAPPEAQARAAAPTTARVTAGGLAIHINAMNPQVARAGSTVNVQGTITNGTRQHQAGLQVQLDTSAIHFTTRDGLKSYLSSGQASGLVPVGDSFGVSASVAPGATISWSTSFQVGTAGIAAFGVYPVTAELQAVATLGVLSSDRTTLPYWPASQAAAGLQSRLKISWLWPLIDQPHHRACAALTGNSLAAGLSPDGRLSALLSAGSSHEDARLTWMIDPALLSDVTTMSSRYQVGGQANCTGATSEPASPAAVSWLTSLRKITAAQPAVLTPYANVDMPALVHQDLTKDLATAFSLGRDVGDAVLRGKFGPDIAWPAGGTADLSVLTNLAAAEHVGTVVLNSSQLPALAAGSFSPDDAVTSLRVAGRPLNVLLSDSTLTGVLRAGDTSSGTLPKGTEFDVRQRFLAETAMIAAEAPESARTIVVAPPYDWSPSQALAGDLLDETANAPWLAPAPLASLSSAPDTQRGVHRQPLPSSKKSPGELSAGYLDQVRTVGTELAGYNSMLYKPSGGYPQSLDEALVATESAAWRGSRARQGAALANSLSRYIEGAEKKVKIIASTQVQMGGSSGLVPFSVQNGLLVQTIRVRVVVSVYKTPSRTSQLAVGHFQDLLIIPHGQSRTVRLPVSSAPQGTTVLHVSLASADGTALRFVKLRQLNVLSTRYGRAILFLIGAAMGVLVLTSLFRGGRRRRMRGDTNLVNEEADPPGSVVTGTSDARYPTEAPDDLADARRWADDA